MARIFLVPKQGPARSIGPGTLAPPLDLDAMLGDAAASTPAYSFLHLRQKGMEFMPYDATVRLTVPKEATDVALIGAQAASSLADLAIWDLAHALAVGSTLVLVEPGVFCDCILERAYFSGVFEAETVSAQGWQVTRYKKVATTASEHDAGLGNWTFGLPVGAVTQALVDQMAGMVGDLGLARWELVFAVSKMPDENSPVRLPEHVRLIDADGATITQKKNRIADEAAHENLCIFHDRLELPRNFRDAVARFGDHYGICGFQQLFFDKSRDSLERYSDYHVDLGDGRSLLDTRTEDSPGSLYVKSLETRLRFRARFAEAHPAEYDRRTYLTGSLYLTKTSVWQLIGQNPHIEWNELEDVEFGERAMAKYGVPCRLNPFAFGFTNRVRAVLVGAHEVARRDAGSAVVRINSGYRSGTVSTKSTGLDQLLMRQRAWELFKLFGLPEHDFEMRTHIFTAPLNTQRQYADFWIRLMYRMALPRRISSVNRFLSMFSVAAFGFRYDSGTLNSLATGISRGGFFIDHVVKDNYFIRSLANLPNLVNPMGDSAEDVLMEQAMALWRRGGDYVYPYQSFEEFWTILTGSLRDTAAADGAK